MYKEIRIGRRCVGKDTKPFIMAELSGNHNNSYETAKAMIEAAEKAGADAVKLQTYTADSMTLNIDSDHFRIMEKDSLWYGEHLYDLYRRASTPYEWHEGLFGYAKQLGLEAFSSPFDESAVDFLETLHVPAYKIASFELTDIPLIKRVAKTKKPIILSTGMAEKHEIKEAIAAANESGAEDIILLKCTSSYPAAAAECNLSTIKDMERHFSCLIGLSDHTVGSHIAAASIALGAVLVEKHFVLDRSEGGVDAVFSLEPDEFAEMVNEISDVYDSMGKVVYGGAESENKAKYYRRSIFASRNIKKGEKLDRTNLIIVRPSLGLEPKYFESLMKKKASKDIAAGEPMTWEHIEN